MNAPSLAELDVAALHERLRERLAELSAPVVSDVLRVFLEVSQLPCTGRLWSLEFAFDEDEGRIARLEARFAKRDLSDENLDDLPRYEVQILLPKFLPPYDQGQGGTAITGAPDAETETDTAPGGLVQRFLAALADMGAFRVIEGLEVRSANVYVY